MGLSFLFKARKSWKRPFLLSSSCQSPAVFFGDFHFRPTAGHHGLGGYSRLLNELRAAASGAFVC